MEVHDNREMKALYFDLRVNDLRKHYSETSPNGGYAKIRDYLLDHDFSHEQYSGYHTNYKTTDVDIFNFVSKMHMELPWLEYCLNHFEVSNIGANHDLMKLYDNKVPRPKDKEK